MGADIGLCYVGPTGTGVGWARRARSCLGRRLQPQASSAARLAATTKRRAATGCSASKATSTGNAGPGQTGSSARGLSVHRRRRLRLVQQMASFGARPHRIRLGPLDDLRHRRRGLDERRGRNQLHRLRHFPRHGPFGQQDGVGTDRRLGFEYAFWNNFSFGLEGRYSWYGTKTYNAGLLATVFTPNIGAAGGTFTFAPSTQTVKLERSRSWPS